MENLYTSEPRKDTNIITEIKKCFLIKGNTQFLFLLCHSSYTHSCKPAKIAKVIFFIEEL